MAPLAAVGAVLFYVSDASLALNRFRQPIPHGALLAMGVYWLGQLGIAIAAAASSLRAVGRIGPQRARADARDDRLAEAEEADLVEQRVHPADGDAVVLVARRGVVNRRGARATGSGPPAAATAPSGAGFFVCAHLWNWLVQNTNTP